MGEPAEKVEHIPDATNAAPEGASVAHAAPSTDSGDIAPVELVLVEESAPADNGETVRELRREIKSLKSKLVNQDSYIFEMKALLQSGKGLSNILNLPQLLDTFMSVVREKYGVINSCVMLKDELEEDKDFYQVKRFYGLDPTYVDGKGRREALYMFRFVKDNGLLWQQIQQGNVFSVRDLQKEPRFIQAWERWNLDVLHSDVWVPLIKRGDVLGILTLGEKADGTQIREAEYSFVQELASIATTIIDSTIKYEKNQRILNNIQTLYDVNQQMANLNDFKTLAAQFIENAVKSLKAQKGNLMLINKTTGKLEVKVVWGYLEDRVIKGINSGTIETKSYSMGEGIAGKAAQERKPVIVNDRDQIPQTSQHEVHCICSVPVINGTNLEGVINITNKVTTNERGETVTDPLGRFTKEDISLLQGLADQAAVSLHKARLYSASITDRMTGLFNTRHFEETFSSEVIKSVERAQPLSIAIVDIDHFKAFNDSYGHTAGDHVLKHVAGLFSKSKREGSQDMAFRYGGEEFCMLLPDTAPETAGQIMEELRKTIEKTVVPYGNNELRITVSIGIAATLVDSNDPKQLFNYADEALYACKSAGRNQVRIYQTGAKIIVHDGFGQLKQMNVGITGGTKSKK